MARSFDRPRADDRRGEGLEGDRAGVADVGERVEERREVEVPGAEVAAVVLADVHVAEPVADRADGADEVVLLDVHVVGVEVDQDVVGADVVGQAQRVGGGVDHVGLVAVADLQARASCRVRRPHSARSRSTATTLRAPGRRQRMAVLAQCAVERAGEVRAAQLVGDLQGIGEQLGSAATTSGSSLETSAVKASPREQATCSPAASSSARAASTSRLGESCSDSSSRSIAGRLVCVMAMVTDSGEVSPTHTRAWMPIGLTWQTWTSEAPWIGSVTRRVQAGMAPVIRRDDLFAGRLVGTTSADAASGPHDPDLVGQSQHLLEVVADQQHGVAVVAQLADQLFDFRGLLDAQGRGRLVHDDELRAEAGGPADGYGLTLAAGEAAHPGGDCGHVDGQGRDHLARLRVSCRDGRAAGTGRRRRLLAVEEEVLPDGEVFDERQVLVHGLDAGLAGVVGGVEVQLRRRRR